MTTKICDDCGEHESDRTVLGMSLCSLCGRMRQEQLEEKVEQITLLILEAVGGGTTEAKEFAGMVLAQIRDIEVMQNEELAFHSCKC